MIGESVAATSLTRIEEDVRRFWQLYGVPEAVRAQRAGGTSYTVFQQPLDAVGQPWAQQAPSLAVGDVVARYHAMRGAAVQRPIGWNCQGVAVEVTVERALEPNLAGMDVAQFNAACQQVAIDGLSEVESQACWLGVWLDPAQTYTNLDPQSVSKVWGGLWRLWIQDRLRQELRVVPFCPRCATPLSEAQAARRIEETETLSVWMQLPWDGDSNAYFLVWTPTPWMLVGMTALAVHPDVRYALVETRDQEDQPPIRLLLAEAALGRELAGNYRVVRRLTGKSLRGARYRPAFTFIPAGEGNGRIVLSKDVPLDRGTGLLPVAPTFDAKSLALARSQGLLIPSLLDGWGRMEDTIMTWWGRTPLEVEPLLVAELEARGLVFRRRPEWRRQSLCPYCATPLLPMSRQVWLAELRDGPWILSRDRAWGTPLPVWACKDCGKQTCVAGLDDLAHRAGVDPAQLDPFRPAIDRLAWRCESCDGWMRRLAPVIDADLDVALLPWLIASPRDDTVGLAVGTESGGGDWLHAVNQIALSVTNAPAWQQGLTLAESTATAIPTWSRPSGAPPQTPGWPTPADAVRWAIYTGTVPDQAEQRFLRPLWAFAASLVGGDGLRSVSTPATVLAALDRWIPARLHRAIGIVTQALDANLIGPAARELEALIGELSTWLPWLQTSRGGLPEGRMVELAITTVSRLAAPFVPHSAEAVHRLLSVPTGQSVHLAAWPVPDPSWEDAGLVARMAVAGRLTLLGQQARRQWGDGADRRCKLALIGHTSREPRDQDGLEPMTALLAATLGAAHVRIAPQLDEVEWHLSLRREQAAKRGLDTAVLDAALDGLDSQTRADLVQRLWDGFSVRVEPGGTSGSTLFPEEVEIRVSARPGWAAAAEAGYVVLLQSDDL